MYGPVEDFQGALSTFTEMSLMILRDSHVTGGSKPFGAYINILARCDVTRILLLMYLQVWTCGYVLSCSGHCLYIEAMIEVIVKVVRSCWKFRIVIIRCMDLLWFILLQPTPQRIKPEHAKLLEQYTWDSQGDSSPVHYLQDDVFLTLQSVVVCTYILLDLL